LARQVFYRTRLQEESAGRAIFPIADAYSTENVTSANLRQLLAIRLGKASQVVPLAMNLNGLDPQQYRGLTQRIFSSINSLWPAVIALLLLRKND
jgi:hypothetical protein